MIDIITFDLEQADEATERLSEEAAVELLTGLFTDMVLKEIGEDKY